MRLLTFQPYYVMDTINNKGHYTASNENCLKDKIFCIEINEHTMDRLYMIGPALPQVGIIFNVDEDKVEKLDYIKWVNAINDNSWENREISEFIGDSKYTEILVDNIWKGQVEQYILVSDSSDEDEVQQDFQEKHFYDLEKLAGYRYYRMDDTEYKDLMETTKGYDFVRAITKCMISDNAITEEDMDSAIEYIHKYMRSRKISD